MHPIEQDCWDTHSAGLGIETYLCAPWAKRLLIAVWNKNPRQGWVEWPKRVHAWITAQDPKVSPRILFMWGYHDVSNATMAFLGYLDEINDRSLLPWELEVLWRAKARPFITLQDPEV
jgi:hypothetical protein